MLLASLALVLQVDAVVKSVVMTTLAPAMAQADAMPQCGGAMAGMTHAPAPSAPDRHGKPAAPATCPYCFAAAHAPLTAQAPPLRPSASVSFAAMRMAASLGPRGPPAVRPRARDPPPSA